MDLRKIIGTRPLIICACGCLIFDNDGRVLLQKRDDDDLWGNPGGSMELGETVYETVKREVFEETNLEIDELEIFNIYSGEEQHHIYPSGDEAYFVNIIFKTNKIKGELKARDNESKELKFFNIEDMPNNITKPFICVKEDLMKLQAKRAKKQPPVL